MRALVQRVTSGGVSVNGGEKRSIGAGLVILLGVAHDDTPEIADAMAAKCALLRIFEDSDGKMNRSLIDCGGDALVVSQFTLYADTRKGRRPSFTDAALPPVAIPLYERFVEALRGHGVAVVTGEFGAEMHVDIQNDGPVTLMLELPVK